MSNFDPMLRHCSGIRFCLFLAFVSPAMSEVAIRKAVFSDRQLFWPELRGKGKPASVKHPGMAPHPDGAGPIRLVVLPIRVEKYSETMPCDSCHRLSANGMEFFLENYLRERMEKRFPQGRVELAAPSDPLMANRLDLMAYLDSLRLPWDKWLPDADETVVYRPRDHFTGTAMRRRMDKLGGVLGANYLLLPVRMSVKVKPVASNAHLGGLEWGFSLVLWNVPAGCPEWAIEYRESDPAMDLDESLKDRLDRTLGAVWDGLPGELAAQWAAEPR